MNQDQFWMEWALSLAQAAAQQDEVPVGAIIVKNDRLLSTGMNLRETLNDPSAHCEILAIRRAANLLESWRLIDCDLYVTLEPCIMCAGAIYQSRIRRVIYGTADSKGGAMGSLYEIQNDKRLNHQVSVSQGILEDPCRGVLQDFFRKRRRRSKPSPGN